jgi:dihydrofolate reductase
VQQYLAAGLIEELQLHIVPLLLGDGERLLENVGDLRLEQTRVIEAPGVVHLTYRVNP